MENTLQEVLPELDAGELSSQTEKIVVRRVAKTRDRSELRLYVTCRDLIEKKKIYRLESLIKKQYFPKRPVRVRIIEEFRLADASPADIFALYRDSMLLELKERHLADSLILEKAEVCFPEEDILELQIGDSLIARTRAPEVKKYLEQVYEERFGFHQSVRVVCAGSEDGAGPVQDGDPYAPVSVSMDRLRTAGKRPDAQSGDRAGGRPPYRKRTARLAEEDGWGRDFGEEPFRIADITDEIGEVVIQGKVLSPETRETRTGGRLTVFSVTDFTDTIRVKIFCRAEEDDALKRFVKEGAWIRLKGRAVLDQDMYSRENEVCIRSVTGIKPWTDTRQARQDRAEVKRVELHCHTQMSDMDAIAPVKDIISMAAEFGHRAVAITDHGVVQAFPDAMSAAKKKGIKILYGCEGYLADVPEGASAEDVFRANTYHIILIAQNDIGRINLYHIVSASHLQYFYRRPRIPRFLLERYREGILVGSACEAGEVFRAVLEQKDHAEQLRIAGFYDYLEIQPIQNNAFLLREDRYGIREDEQLRDLNRRIVDLGAELGKPVVATGDVHFLEAEDEVYRRIIMTGKKYKDADFQPPLYFRTTEEMLAEFSYFGEKKARELVIDNPNLIADCCDGILPVRMDKCPPQIEGSEEELRRLCDERARAIYGDPLPEMIRERLDKELNSIIGNGYAVMYIIAQRLVQKSESDGYVVGSRGSVGSSLAAMMAGITEVNPLPPHYVCPSCRWSELDTEEVRQYANLSGYDMPDKMCPRCGTKMSKQGFNIPFETFLGFTGNKEPDIDLNFSGEYQAHAHEYTEELFGAENTFRAGTIEGLAEKTAYRYVASYFEEKNIEKRKCEVERLAAGCVGIRNTTGQHPGGIVVLPKGEDIDSFTPIQYPANRKDSPVTTHFDYHKIEQNLLKLDLLGHNDPSMIRRIEELTGLNLRDVPMDDPKVMSLFRETTALGITPEQIGGCPLGTLGIPEFNTTPAMNMLIDTKPEHFSDLVRIAGLGHGEGVWQGNARELILSGTATLGTAICTRDDIMLYLISMGIDKAQSFTISESVRKGRGLKPEWEGIMTESGIPDWYIESCKRIQYMFPKAHAAAYVIMAWRIAWAKVYRPEEFYTAYFGIRAKGFDYETIVARPEQMTRELAAMRKTDEKKLTGAEKDSLRAMRMAEEMLARGISFAPIDLYRAQAVRFILADGKVMPSLTSIEGMGEKAAMSVVEEAKKGRFLSQEDFLQRTGVSGPTTELMAELGLFGDLPKSNQISFFDIEPAG